MLYAIPHNFFRSVDSLIWPSIRNKTVPRWHQGIIKFQVGFSGISIVNSMRQLATPHFYRYFLKCHRGVRNSRVTKSCYETELRKMTSHFELLTENFFIEVLLSSYENTKIFLKILN